MSAESPREYASIVAQVQALHNAGASIDESLDELRAFNVSPVDAIKSIRDVFGLPTNEAKDRLHRNPAWSGLQESFKQFHDDAESATTDLNKHTE